MPPQLGPWCEQLAASLGCMPALRELWVRVHEWPGMRPEPVPAAAGAVLIHAIAGKAGLSLCMLEQLPIGPDVDIGDIWSSAPLSPLKRRQLFVL